MQLCHGGSSDDGAGELTTCMWSIAQQCVGTLIHMMWLTVMLSTHAAGCMKREDVIQYAFLPAQFFVLNSIITHEWLSEKNFESIKKCFSEEDSPTPSVSEFKNKTERSY